MKSQKFLLTLFAIPLLAQDATRDLLQKLADAPGPPGFEEPVRKIMVDAMKPYASSIKYDGTGSILATQGTDGPRIMVDAHMDELGGVIRRITPRGLLTMQMLGGWLDQALVDQRWLIIGAKGPIHAVGHRTKNPRFHALIQSFGVFDAHTSLHSPFMLMT